MLVSAFPATLARKPQAHRHLPLTMASGSSSSAPVETISSPVSNGTDNFNWDELDWSNGGFPDLTDEQVKQIQAMIDATVAALPDLSSQKPADPTVADPFGLDFRMSTPITQFISRLTGVIDFVD